MENSETKTLWISIAAALFAVFILYSWSQEQKAALHKKYGTKKLVVVAAKNIDEMQVIDESLLELVERPIDFIQPGALQTPEVAIGQMAAAPIKKGEQLLNTKLLLPGRDTGLSMQVTPGKRAISLGVNEVSGVAKLVKPGDRIDIIIAIDVGSGQEKRREVKTLMQDVPVLAVGQNIVDTIPVQIEEDGDDNLLLNNLRRSTNFRSITIEGAPSEIQQLVYMNTTNPGGIITVLRNPNDQQKYRMPTISSDDLMGKPKVRRQVASKKPKIKVPSTSAKPKARGKNRRVDADGFEEI